MVFSRGENITQQVSDTGMAFDGHLPVRVLADHLSIDRIMVIQGGRYGYGGSSAIRFLARPGRRMVDDLLPVFIAIFFGHKVQSCCMGDPNSLTYFFCFTFD